MLPPRAYAEPLPVMPTGVRVDPVPADARPALIVAVPAADVEQFPNQLFTRYPARNTIDAIRLIERWRPRVVAIDWDAPDFDGKAICASARQSAGTGVLVMTLRPENAPAAIKAGCHALLLKPFAPNLLAARLGRLSREIPAPQVANRLPEKLGQFGTHRMWPDVSCPHCRHAGAVSFEHSSHRRSWYACLSCDQVWLARRQE
jgi:DNA-binding response OmpR family regulator